MKKLKLLITVLALFVVMFVFEGCKKDENPATDCSAQLETASKCKATLPDCGGDKIKNSTQCLGVNSDGVTRCKNPTLFPCGYCNKHQEQWNGSCPNETKNACGYCDDHKDQYTGD